MLALPISMQDKSIVVFEKLSTNTASFSMCSFSRNKSPSGGSAISLFSASRVDRAITTVNFIDW